MLVDDMDDYEDVTIKTHKSNSKMNKINDYDYFVLADNFLKVFKKEKKRGNYLKNKKSEFDKSKKKWVIYDLHYVVLIWLVDFLDEF
mgnify:CR=1 FL=1